MSISFTPYLIVCPLLFLSGFVDSIGGGGGLISIPAFLMAGLSPHAAIATNKLGAFGGLTLSAARFAKSGCLSLKLSVFSVIAAILGSFLGAHLSLLVSENVMSHILIFVLPLSAFFVLNKRFFNDEGHDAVSLDRRTIFTAVTAAFIIGGYDGFYGPGTGTFLIIAFTAFAHLSVKTASGQAKIINLTTNITSLIVFLLNGQVLIPLGLAGCVCSMLGGYLGAGLALKNGAKIVRPIILAVLLLLLIKVIAG